MKQRIIHALVDQQGTACHETAVCGHCDSLKYRQDWNERLARDATKDRASAPLADSWQECSSNDALVCTVCGHTNFPPGAAGLPNCEECGFSDPTARRGRHHRFDCSRYVR